MAIGEKKRYLICYDIANAKRLSRVHHHVSQQAMLIQYSVYLFYGNRNDLDNLIASLREIIDSKEDDIRIYPLPKQIKLTTGGKFIAQDLLILTGPELAGLQKNALS